MAVCRGSFRQGPGQHEQDDGRRAAVFERARAFIKRSTGSHHIIDQNDGFACQVGITMECAADVFLALPPGQPGLCGRIADALAQCGRQRSSEPGGQRAGEFERLVESAFAQPRRMQWKRRDQVGAGSCFRRRGRTHCRIGKRCQSASEVATQRQLMPVFECLNQPVERKTVSESCVSGVKMRRMDKTATADFALRRG